MLREFQMPRFRTSTLVFHPGSLARTARQAASLPPISSFYIPFFRESFSLHFKSRVFSKVPSFLSSSVASECAHTVCGGGFELSHCFFGRLHPFNQKKGDQRRESIGRSFSATTRGEEEKLVWMERGSLLPPQLKRKPAASGPVGFGGLQLFSHHPPPRELGGLGPSESFQSPSSSFFSHGPPPRAEREMGRGKRRS